MKLNVKSFFAIMMLICMLIMAIGCNNKKKEPEKVAGNDEFFTQSLISGENGSGDSSNGNQSGDSSQSGGSQGQTTVPDENKIDGKSWNEVLTAMPKNLRGTSLTVYNWNPASEYTGAPEVISQFTKHTGIKVDWRVVSYTDYFTKLASLIASGENIPDVARTLGPVPSQMLNYQPLKTTGYDFSDAAWDKNIMDMYSVGSKVYATSLKNTHIGSVDLMFYNKGLIEKYDLEDPYKLWKSGKWNWEKFLEMCEEYNDNSGSPALTGERWTKPFFSSRGLSGPIGFNGSKYYNATKGSAFLKLYQELGDLYNKDDLFLRGNLQRFDDGDALFSAGGAVHARKKNSRYGVLKSSNQLYAVPLPVPKNQKTYYQGAEETEAYAVVNGAPNAKAVPYFLRYFLDGANYDLDTYFCNKQNLEVYNWCMSQKNKVYYYAFNEYTAGNQNNGIDYQTGAQVKKYIDANNGLVDREVKEYNETLAKLK